MSFHDEPAHSHLYDLQLKAVQHSADRCGQEKPYAAQSLDALQEGPALSGLRRLEQAEAFHAGPASAPAARVRKALKDPRVIWVCTPVLDKLQYALMPEVF